MKKAIIPTVSVVLLTVFPVLFLFFSNITAAKFSEIFPPLFIYLSVGIITYAISWVLTKSAVYGALISYPFILLFYNYSTIENLLESFFSSLKYWHILPICIFVLIHLSYFLYKKCPGDLATIIVQVISGVTALLIVFNLATSIPSLMKIMQLNIQGDNELNSNQIRIENSKDLPNVYWLLFDEYSSFKVMNKYYDYDNLELKNGLEKLGFNLSFSSQNDSHKSSTVFANYFNLDYIVDDTVDEAVKFEKTKNNKILKLFNDLGYKTVGYGLSNELLGDDAPYIDYKEIKSKRHSQTMGGKSLQNILLDSTFFYPFITQARDSFSGIILDTFDKLQNPNEETVPIVSLSYLKTPHEPFLFDAKGNLNSAEDYYNWIDKSIYRDQAIFVGNLILETMKQIVDNDPEAIIILQSDHSARAASENSLYRKWISVDDMRSILNAVYYKNEKLDIEGCSGVNTLRKVFGKAFELDLPMLEVPVNE